jgi:hypothetical protein
MSSTHDQPKPISPSRFKRKRPDCDHWDIRERTPQANGPGVAPIQSSNAPSLAPHESPDSLRETSPANQRPSKEINFDLNVALDADGEPLDQSPRVLTASRSAEAMPHLRSSNVEYQLEGQSIRLLLTSWVNYLAIINLMNWFSKCLILFL